MSIQSEFSESRARGNGQLKITVCENLSESGVL
jgi:hypothetical protein